ncbi:MAG: N-acetyl-gamma-glutamyl-phosphate reductase [Pseudoflavonifractor sp.]|nr:N-acetyl-gamma-glutamyl-phosphate reductase [Alloprevotella sp.]MCM1117244.1 N-acetyl-gamma-glutamyl-phosphate reductase [Pseudoflavonifractor sp.]
MIKVGIIGGAGYTAGELIRLLINHPEAEIKFIHSTSNAGAPVTSVHGGLLGETTLCFSSEHPLDEIDCLFLCSAHGKSREFWEQNSRPSGLKVIDLAQDFRDETGGYVYGLPELQLDKIKKAQLIANPGCFATAIQLSLLPLAKARALAGSIAITAVTGSTGAGVKPGATTHFSWRNDNLSVYKPFFHQHIAEITRSLASLQPGITQEQICFIPVRGDFPRGIFAMTQIENTLQPGEALQLFKEFYEGHPFTIVSEGPIDLKQAVNTNKAIISVQEDPIRHRLLITAAIDNLIKGASGQAVQNFNLIFGLDQRTGLRLKPSAF